VSDFQATNSFVATPEELTLYSSLTQFSAAIDDEEQIDLEDLEQRVHDAFGQSAQAIRMNQDFQNHIRALSNSIIAVKIKPVDDASLLAELSRLIRLVDLIERIASRDENLAIPGAVESVLSESLVLPPNLFPLPPETISVPEPEEDPEETARRHEIEELQTKAVGLRLALMQLLATSPRDLRQPSPAPEPSEPSPAPFPRRSRSFLNRLSFRLAPAYVRSVGGDLATRPDTSRESQFLRPEAIERFSAETQVLLQELGADLTDISVPAALTRLEAELTAVGDRLAMIEPAPTTRSILRVGRTFVPAQPPLPAFDLRFATSEGSGVPETVGMVRPVGVGNLLLVRQQIKRYEPGEIAHIENVLRGESKSRGTRRLRRTEETFTLITETTTEEERDLQTTERFELQQETTKTIQQDESFNVGVSVSAGYGPFFQVNSNFGFSSATSTTDTAKKAFTYAKDVTERSASRISERVRREETIRTIQEFEETNNHDLNNVGGDGHVIGIYQWVDKVYEAQIFDYGLRQFFDFIVPEPAAFFFKALEANNSETEDLKGPELFTAPPNKIDESNYKKYILQYQVTGVEPPPPAVITISRAYDEAVQTVGADFTHSEHFDIPDGYVAWQAHVVAHITAWVTHDGEDIEWGTQLIHLSIGRESWTHHAGDGVTTHTFTLSKEQKSIPVSLMTFYVSSYSVTIEIECKRTNRHFEKWQLDTHAAIMQAYFKLQSDYEAKLAAAAAQLGVEIEGRNPLENRLLERAELKKQCISLLTAQHFDLFSAILESPGTFPRIDFDEADAEGRYIRFFEQVFEWENMTYVFYPYFWGRKSKWLERILWRDIDPIHAEFLKSGAARVVVPVRLGFEKAMVHFLDTGQVWEGGDLPEIGDPLYVDILEEIKERLKAPGDEIPVFEPWEVRLPTTLVRLRPDSSLPQWEKDEEGNWHPVESNDS
jgi:hypothetical protein